MNEGDLIALVFTESRAVRAFGVFDNEADAADFVASDALPDQYVSFAIVPVELVVGLDEEE